VSRVLLTGASGLIGRNVVPALLAAGHEVHAVARTPARESAGARWHSAELLSGDGPHALIDAVRPDALLHLAWYAEHGRFWGSPENVRWVGASLELLRRFALAGGRRAVIAGSCAEYDWRSGLAASASGELPRLREQNSPLHPATLYGASKDATQKVAATFAEEAGVGLAWGRVFFLYGPGEQPGRLVPAVATALLAGERVPTSDGAQIRDFLHVRDVADAFVALLDSEVCGPVNIASGEPLAVGSLIEAIASDVGRPELIEWGALPRREGEPEVLLADTTRLREEVGFSPSVVLTEGVSETVEYWRSAR
jgi:nucleoside-diphosphate-sugar epimerase